MFSDSVKDWYAVAGKGMAKGIKNDKNFKQHMIKPCSMVMMIGNTGSGKTTALVDFLSRKNDSFYQVIYFTGSTSDEPLLNFLQQHIDGIEIIDDADSLPELTELNDSEKKQEKLIIFDDIINLPKKQLCKIQKWFNSSRKYGFTCVAMVQNYTDAPIQMRRNTQYFILFRLNDMNTINQILKNHNNNGDVKELVKEAYFASTSKPKDFFMLDLTPNSPARYRHCFKDIISI